MFNIVCVIGYKPTKCIIYYTFSGTLQKINVKKNKKNVYKSEHICKCCVYSQKQKQFIMDKQQIIDLLKSKEAELYAELLDMRSSFGNNDRGTLHTQAQWGAIVNILDTIEEYENN